MDFTQPPFFVFTGGSILIILMPTDAKRNLTVPGLIFKNSLGGYATRILSDRT